MNYLNEAANGTEGNFTDRCVEQLKQATVDVASWNEANLRLNNELARVRNDKEVAYQHLGNATTKLRASQEAVAAWQSQYATLQDENERYIQERDEARDSLREMREDRDFLLKELKEYADKNKELNKELQDLYAKFRGTLPPRAADRLLIAQGKARYVRSQLEQLCAEIGVVEGDIAYATKAE